MLFICGGSYDGHKLIVEPLSKLVFMLTYHTRTRQAKVATLLGALARGYHLWDGEDALPTLPLTKCCLHAHD